MKKLLSALLALALAATFTACTSTVDTDPENGETDVNVDTEVQGNEDSEAQTGAEGEDAQGETADGSETEAETETAVEETVVRLAGLKGPTSMGLVKLLEEDEAGTSVNDYEFTIAGTADEITPNLIKGELDIAAVPANLASVLYNKTEGAVQVLAVNTLGVVYIVEKGGVVSELSDLVGKTIYATGKGSTPEYALRYILSQNGIDPDNDVTIEFKSEPTEVVALLNANESGVAMLPQPYVTVAESSVEGLTTVIDLNAEWDKLETGSKLVTGVVVARKEFVESYPNTVNAFLDEYQASTEYANTNVDETASLVEKYGIVKAAVAKKALPFCNINFIKGEEMKLAVAGYLEILAGQNVNAVGGKLPDDAFYYIAE